MFDGGLVFIGIYCLHKHFVVVWFKKFVWINIQFNQACRDDHVLMSSNNDINQQPIHRPIIPFHVETPPTMFKHLVVVVDLMVFGDVVKGVHVQHMPTRGKMLH